jgi:hypothetical protein
MTTSSLSFASVTDAELIAEVTHLASSERHATVQLIASLAELDVRRLYLGQGCSSLFTYCTQVLHLSEHAAYGRIEAARAARRFPALLERLANGSITLTTITLLAPVLTPDNHVELLEAARHKSKRQVEELVAQERPKPALESFIRKVPARRPAAILSAPAACLGPSNADPVTPAPTTDAGKAAPTPVVSASHASRPIAPHTARLVVMAPLSPELYKLQVTLPSETMEKLRRAQDLLRHTIPSGDTAAILDRALTLLLMQLERRKVGATGAPRAARDVALGSRHIPAAVRREVWARDGGQCAFVGAAGRCNERGFLEFHHVAPYAAGCDARVETIALRCRAHNQYEAMLDFGLGAVTGRCAQRRAYLKTDANSVQTELSLKCGADSRSE